MKRLEAAEDVVYMGFLVHKPATTLIAEDLVNEVGIETEQSPRQKPLRDMNHGARQMSKAFMLLVMLVHQ